jgi:tetratricopeptide (TPR) repeat protein
LRPALLIWVAALTLTLRTTNAIADRSAGTAPSEVAATQNAADSSKLAHSARLEAREHFERGLALVKTGDLARAVDAFDAAYTLSPKFSVLYNLGQALAALGRPVAAKRALEQYLEQGGEQVPTNRRARAVELIKEQQRRIGFVVIRSAQHGAELLVDGEQVGRTPLVEPVPLAAGQHGIVAQAAGFRVFTTSIAVAPEATTEIVIELTAELPVQSPKASALPADPRRTERALLTRPPRARAAPALPNSSKRTAWIVATSATGIALGAVSVSLGIWNQGRYDQWRRDRSAVDSKLAMGPEDSTTRRDRLALYGRGASIQAVDDLALSAAILGASALITAGVLWLTGETRAVQQR